MCNSYEQRIGYAAYRAAMAAIELEVADWNSETDLPAADMVRIGDVAPVMRLAGEAVELAQMRFGFPPPRPKASPIFNFRSESRSFAESRRCLIPASAFFEYTGSKSPKMRHRFALADEPFLCIAGIWRPGEGDQPPAFSMLTCAPGPDVLPYHHRQVVVLPPINWRGWLWFSDEELLRALPAGALAVG